ncbi:hypothetical protein GLOIN_2v1489307 [Rhizophagus irregularis DAOM 181602=DAOM 197198]|uniref:Uncharacterized protein n=1 Tax=Rhizophagus irregularis (strain DAOM 181602 / DAOM 197198 / MUCL 43194) TaxID=747089 RepID=A0A2P4NU44_RHIID|nr:hypothetical protein GLOIN_2v1489307 [Rhizophagus irregularis DAOM 181602=DAOM 197198]POG56640.1 hypothetical protein GLOIN_2v1489307 [Rhizophagus irregularis DAOM 181602=DAOM 197198]|eukprot:XP_025164364.1 hypothetical protein GLOIN_2v1489307 [Rhizophagus irregularis DAOM 181602=DAOM 197198]
MFSTNTFSFKDRYDNDDLNINPENSVDDFFDNIADYEEDFNFIQNNENAFHLAMKRALDNNSDSSVNNDFEDEANDYDTNKSETTANTSINVELNIEQINHKDLLNCAIVDVIDGKLQKCNSNIKLRGLWQLIGTWQLDNDAVLQAGKNLDKLGVCYTHFLFDQNKLHKEGAKEDKDVNQIVESFAKNIHGKY